MAPHDTNTRREARRHKAPLIGLALIVGVILLLFLWWVAGATGLVGDAEPVPEGGLQPESVETNDPAPGTPPPPPDPAQ